MFALADQAKIKRRSGSGKASSATIENDTAALRSRELIGDETLLWGSNHPHTDST